jgi:hypothetical protein
MLDVLADNFVIFDNGIFSLADFEHTPLEHCNVVFALHNYKTFSTIRCLAWFHLVEQDIKM